MTCQVYLTFQVYIFMGLIAFMDLNLKEKIILVTGGSNGLGYACAKILAVEGAKVIISYRSE